MLFLPKPEVIGQPECPILHRWTLLQFGRRVQEGSGVARQYKLLLHHFLPHADDRDPHDHPRSFLTLVLKGGYDDISTHYTEDDVVHKYAPVGPSTAGLRGVVTDRLRTGSIRFRSAEHQHTTSVHPDGAWTLVLMGPLRRPWGFWPDGLWMPWRQYHEMFGDSMRCD
jgi:hypothetical protein